MLEDVPPDHHHVRTERLDLRPPTSDDVDALFAIQSDPRVWTHFPSGRLTQRAQTEGRVAGWIAGWAEGLGTWVARGHGDERVLGYGGCGLRRRPDGEPAVWNLGYRFAVAAHGRGLATELSRAALDHAAQVRPDVPVVAYLLEHNLASAAVARKVGLELIHRGPDAGNPDPTAVRLVFADRPLTAAQLDLVLG